jgi:hypothetical protein
MKNRRIERSAGQIRSNMEPRPEVRLRTNEKIRMEWIKGAKKRIESLSCEKSEPKEPE